MPVDVTQLVVDTKPSLEDELGSDELQEELVAADAAGAKGNWEEALTHWEAALELAESSLGIHSITVTVLLGVARTQRRLGRLDQVKETLDSAREQALGVLDKNKV